MYIMYRDQTKLDLDVSIVVTFEEEKKVGVVIGMVQRILLDLCQFVFLDLPGGYLDVHLWSLFELYIYFCTNDLYVILYNIFLNKKGQVKKKKKYSHTIHNFVILKKEKAKTIGSHNDP